MHRTHANSYYWLLLAGFVTVTGCGSEEDDTTTTEDPETTEDAGVAADAATGGKDAATDSGSTKADAGSTPTPDASAPDASAPTADAGDTDGGTLEPVGTPFERGEKIAGDLICITCHRPNFAGFGLYPNITSNEATGIGSWTDTEIGDAITKGIGKDGNMLCSSMQRYTLTTGELADLVAFLRGIPAVNKVNAGGCD